MSGAFRNRYELVTGENRARLPVSGQRGRSIHPIQRRRASSSLTQTPLGRRRSAVEGFYPLPASIRRPCRTPCSGDNRELLWHNKLVTALTPAMKIVDVRATPVYVPMRHPLRWSFGV